MVTDFTPTYQQPRSSQKFGVINKWWSWIRNIQAMASRAMPGIQPSSTERHLRNWVPVRYIAEALQGYVSTFLRQHRLNKALRFLHRPRERHKRVGVRGERIAARFLTQQGYYVWKVNWRCRRGEIDIIAYRDQRLVIVEVKSAAEKHRSSFALHEKVDSTKSKKLQRLASQFLKNNQVELKSRRLQSIRIDTICVELGPLWSKPFIEHFENSVPFD